MIFPRRFIFPFEYLAAEEKIVICKKETMFRCAFMFTTVAVNIASSTVNIDIAVTMPYQHHQSALRHVSFKAKSTIINMTMSKMNYIYSNKKISVGTRALWRCPHVLICRSGTPTLFQRWAFFTPSGLRAYPCTFVEAWLIVHMCCARMTSLVL